MNQNMNGLSWGGEQSNWSTEVRSPQPMPTMPNGMNMQPMPNIMNPQPMPMMPNGMNIQPMPNIMNPQPMPVMPHGMNGKPMPDMTTPSILTPPVEPDSLHIDHGLSQEVVINPINAEENYYGSLKAMLSRNIGQYVVVTYLVGTQDPVSLAGYLHTVGNDYLVIYQPDRERYISGDYYALKFVEFYDTEKLAMEKGKYYEDGQQKTW